MSAAEQSRPQPSVALVVMAKIPTPGQVKTRLIPALGAEGAAALAKQLLIHTLNTVGQTSAFARIELCVSAAVADETLLAHVLMTDIARKFDVTPQGEGDLGARMQRAFERLRHDHDAVIMIGTDAPDITASTLDQAAHDIAKFDAVFTPALDGGYTLIGIGRTLTAPLCALFTDVPWSTPAVMPTTRDRLRQMNADWFEYAPMTDIDEPADLQQLPAHWPWTRHLGGGS